MYKKNRKEVNSDEDVTTILNINEKRAAVNQNFQDIKNQ